MSRPPEGLARALAEAERQVRFHRRLVEADPGRHSPGLASALDAHALLLGLSARREDAVPVAREAVGLYRDLTARKPGEYASAFASSLINLGNQLAGLGHHHHALVPMREAVELCRRLIPAGPELVSSLEFIGVKLGEMGRHDEALAALDEAMDARRSLIETGRTDHAIDHWAGLVALIHQLHEMGRDDEAGPYQRMAARHHRHIVATRPDFVAFLDELLNEHGYSVTATGLRRDPGRGAASTPSRPSRDVLARLRERNEEGLRLMRAGRLDDALVLFRQAIDVLDEESAATATASPLHNLALVLTKLGRYDEALGPLDRAVHLHRALAASDAGHLPQLASSLNNLGWLLLALSRFEDALVPLDEAVALHRRQVESPEGQARSLYNLGVGLGHLRRHREAVAATEEAVGLLRPLAASDPGAHRAGLADALTWLGKQLRHLGRDREARAAEREARRL
ncbi:tetratricopeptide repeat protein [Streptosporangium sp. NPDC002721]|uniref:tetratricopeptide repeat protein n=1 Tax=Streptosporangium sp. NPDC002721 TaxID=3366188 RepID=UPI003673F219